MSKTRSSFQRQQSFHVGRFVALGFRHQSLLRWPSQCMVAFLSCVGPGAAFGPGNVDSHWRHDECFGWREQGLEITGSWIVL